MIRKKLEEYLENDLNRFERQLMNEDSVIQRNNLYWYAVHRGYGAIDFSMSLGLEQSIADELNTWYRNNLEKLLFPTLQDQYFML